MKTLIKTMCLVIVLCIFSNANAQEKDTIMVKNEKVYFKQKVEEIKTAEKKSLKIKIKAINKALEKKQITRESAELQKKKAAEILNSGEFKSFDVQNLYNHGKKC